MSAVRISGVLRPGALSVVRYSVGLVLSAAFNLGLVASLAELDRPTAEEDTHTAHRVAPSVVPPPPPPAPSTSNPTAAPSPTALPAAPPAPALDLPALADLGMGPGIPLDGLEGIGLDGLEDVPLGAATPPAAPDQPPQLASPPDTARFYPREAQRRRISGRTILRLEVGADGHVRSAEVLRSEPPGIFERNAVRAAMTFRFIPAQKKGRPVGARTRMEIKWQPRN